MRTIKLTLAATFAALSTSAYAVTVDINGKTYQSGPNIGLAAELGQTDTTSVAIRVGATYEKLLKDHLELVSQFSPDNIPLSGGREEYWDGFPLDFYVQDNALTSFSISNPTSLRDADWHYVGFDVTFSPTAETVALDALYFPVIGGDVQFGVGYGSTGSDYVNYDPSLLNDAPGTDLFWSDAIGTYYLDNFTATVLPTAGTGTGSKPDLDNITPVPIPAPAVLLTLGLIGLGAVGRKRI